jgi:hypothetical protein
MELSFLKYGKDRSLVEQAISLKYRKTEPALAPSPVTGAPIRKAD